MTFWLTLLFAFAGMGVVFAAAFAIARRIDNYSIVDVAWSFAFAGLATFYALAADGWGPRRGLLALLVAAWSIRLGTHLARRVAAHHPREEGRYEDMRRKWSEHFPAKMFAFFQAQGVSVVVLGWPFLLISQHRTAGFHALELAGAILWLAALIGEAIADAQLARFKRDPANRGRVCTAGLWRFSRHPNYFAEWLVWVAWFLIACAAPWGWTAILAPAAMLYLLLCVTGVPPTEAQSVRSKGDAYRHYQATTPAFFPWRPAPRRL